MGKDEYLNLIPTENSRLPKFMGFLEKILNPVIDLQAVVQNSGAFDVNTAVGNQLDIIGNIVSVSRELPYIPSSGNRYISDDVFNMIVRMRIAQETWDGGNKDAADIYRYIIGDLANIEYKDNMDCSIEIDIGAENVDVVQAIYATQEFLVSAGVGRTLEVEVYSFDISATYGMEIIGIEYENTINLLRGD